MGSVTDGPGAAVLAGADRAAALAAVKAQLRAEAATDDALLAAFAESALGVAEQFTGRVLIARALVAAMPPAATWQRLPVGQVRAITRVAVGGVVLPAEGYAVDIDAAGTGWVRVASAAEVTFTAGMAAVWDALPAPVRQGVVLLAAHLFDDVAGRAVPPAAVTALWRPFRDLHLAMAARA